MSLAGAQNNLWAVKGGNKLVCSGLLKIANANLLQAKVISVSLLHSGTEPKGHVDVKVFSTAFALLKQKCERPITGINGLLQVVNCT